MNKKLLIPIMELDTAWCLRGFNHRYYAKEYCNGVLKIPLECIEESNISSMGLEIQLNNVEHYIKEDWYLQLITLAKDKMIKIDEGTN